MLCEALFGLLWMFLASIKKDKWQMLRLPGDSVLAQYVRVLGATGLQTWVWITSAHVKIQGRLHMPIM